MSAKYLMHVTIDTGHARRSYRDEVQDADVKIVAQTLAKALSGTKTLIRPGYWLEPVVASASLVATVTDDAEHPIVTIAIAGKSRDSAKLWGLQCAIFGARGDPPPAPWCAVKIHSSDPHDAMALFWLGNYERILAWAWLERGDWGA